MALGKLLLLINDEVSLKGLQEHLEPHAEIAAVRTLDAAHDRLGKEDFDLVIADAELIDPGADFLPQNLSGPGPAVVILASAKNFHSVANAECAFGYLLKPFSTEQLDAVLKKADDYGRLLKVNRYLSRGFLSEPVLELVGTSPQMEELRITLRKVGRTHATVLIGGESGVGKELVARTLFLQSPRADAALIKVDCAKIPEHLLERELFGSGKTGLR